MSWNKIDNLLKSIEAFYKKALWSELVIKAQHNDINNAVKETPEERADREADEWLRKNDPGTKTRVESPALEEKYQESAPAEPIEKTKEDTNLYPKIIYFANGTKNSNASDELNVIAELYKEAAKNNKGYSAVSNAINKFMDNLPDYYSDYDDEEDVEPGEENVSPERQAKLEGQNIESLLNEIYGDVNARFGRQRDIEKGFKEPETVAPESSEEDGGGDDYERPGLGTEIDLKELGGKKKRDDGGTPSMGVITIREPKDYVKNYEAQKERYIEQLNDPSISDVIKNNIKENINVLNNLINVTENEAAMLKDGGIAWQVIPKTDASPRRRVPIDPEQKLQWESIKAEQNKLRSANNVIKTNIRRYTALQKNLELDQKIAGTRSEKYKNLLKEKKLLNDLIISKNYNKTKEIEARRALIKYMQGAATDEQIDRFPDQYLGNLSEATLISLRKSIEEGKGVVVDFEKYDALRKEKYTQQRAEVRQTGDIKGIVLKFSQNYSSFLSDNKKLKENAYHSEPSLTGYVKAFAQVYDAASKNPSPENNQRMEIAKSALMQGIEEYKQKLLKVEEVKKMLEALVNNTSGRYSKPRTPWFWLDEIPEDKKMILHELISRISSVNMEFSRPMRWTDQLNFITNNLKERLSPTKIRIAPTEEVGSQPESGTSTQEEVEYIEETPALKQMRLKGYMNKKQRKTILSQINKQAQEVPEAISDTSAEDATKKLFMELWDKSPTRLEGER